MPTIYCAGRTYHGHAREMGAAPAEGARPLVFLKPWGALLAPPGPIRLPREAGEIQHEVELVVRVGVPPRPEAAGLGLDLTARAIQARAKAEGLPWAEAKGFLGSAPLGPLLPLHRLPPLGEIGFALRVNGAPRQRGSTQDLLWPVPRLLEALHAWYGLRRGDLVFTGTPDGVGPLRPGDLLELDLDGVPAGAARFEVEAAPGGIA